MIHLKCPRPSNPEQSVTCYLILMTLGFLTVSNHSWGVTIAVGRGSHPLVHALLTSNIFWPYPLSTLPQTWKQPPSFISQGITWVCNCESLPGRSILSSILHLLVPRLIFPYHTAYHNHKITCSEAGRGPITTHIIGKRESFITMVVGLEVIRAIPFVGHFPVCFSHAFITLLYRSIPLLLITISCKFLL